MRAARLCSHTPRLYRQLCRVRRDSVRLHAPQLRTGPEWWYRPVPPRPLRPSADEPRGHLHDLQELLRSGPYREQRRAERGTCQPPDHVAPICYLANAAGLPIDQNGTLLQNKPTVVPLPGTPITGPTAAPSLPSSQHGANATPPPASPVASAPPNNKPAPNPDPNGVCTAAAAGANTVHSEHGPGEYPGQKVVFDPERGGVWLWLPGARWPVGGRRG